jgi:hypothetical protein
MWALISELVRITKTLVGARESAIGGTGKLTSPAAAFAGDAGHEDRAGSAVGSGVQGGWSSATTGDDRTAAAGPVVGLSHRIRLAHDYYVRVDTCDYSVDLRGDRPVAIRALPDHDALFGVDFNPTATDPTAVPAVEASNP